MRVVGGVYGFPYVRGGMSLAGLHPPPHFKPFSPKTACDSDEVAVLWTMMLAGSRIWFHTTVEDCDGKMRDCPEKVLNSVEAWTGDGAVP
jgi:hypothetical protein